MLAARPAEAHREVNRYCIPCAVGVIFHEGPACSTISPVAQHLHLAISLGGYLGAVLVLAGYAATTTGRFAATHAAVQVANTAGALLLVGNGVLQAAWPSVGLNLVWILIGLVAARRVNGMKDAQRADAAPRAGEAVTPAAAEPAPQGWTATVPLPRVTSEDAAEWAGARSAAA